MDGGGECLAVSQHYKTKRSVLVFSVLILPLKDAHEDILTTAFILVYVMLSLSASKVNCRCSSFKCTSD